jgi:multidrug efflux pump subunit AcrA (membrane-fusion protein)
MTRQRQPSDRLTNPRRTIVPLAIAAVVVIGVSIGSWPYWPTAWQTHLTTLLTSNDDDHDHDSETAGADLDHPQEEDASEPHDEEQHDDATHVESAHEHAEGTAAASLVLSRQARRNIGLTLCTVERRDFQRNVVLPAVIIERPGRSAITVSAPLTGIVTRIFPIPGEAVAPGAPLFDLRLTHEDLVEKQSDLLRDLEQLDVVKQEVDRLEEVTRSGAVAGKTLLERVYEQQKVEGTIRASRQALLLHGLTEEQIDTVEKERRLIREIVVTVPEPDETHALDRHEDYLQVDRLAVRRGDHVMTGSPLLTLTDHCLLYIEGQAFEHDAEDLNRAANENLSVSVLVESNGSGKQMISDLQVLYVDNEVERDSRALKFYVPLPNEILRNDRTPDGHRFIAWRYRPGQRVEVLVPIERWKDRIVLPVESVIQDGVESFIYQECGDHFDRKSVHVTYRDQQSVVIDDDGSLQPGDSVAVHGAYQIHLALKNQANAPDPHAGHQH